MEGEAGVDPLRSDLMTLGAGEPFCMNLADVESNRHSLTSQVKTLLKLLEQIIKYTF